MNKKYILSSAVAVLLMASCADEFDPEYVVEKPVDLAKLAELADYQPLKEYIDRSAHPTFKLGAALNAGDFNKKLTEYNVAVTNFDEIVAGNAMKYASCVDDKGNMDFGTVNTFVTNAVEAGITVYGHTLAWHAQQRPKYLNSLLADRELPVSGEPEITLTEIWSIDYTQFASFPFYVMGYTPEFSPEDGLISAFPGGWYQYFAGTQVNLKEGGNYVLVAKIKSDKDGTVPVQVRWSWGEDPLATQLKIKEGDWQEIKCSFSATKSTAHDLIFQPGGMDANFCIKEMHVYQEEKKQAGQLIMEKYWDDIVTNGNCEGSDASWFTVKENNGALEHVITDGVGKNGSRGVKVYSKAGAEQDWDSQFWITLPDGGWLEEGTKAKVTFDYKASMPASGDTQAHGAPGNYQHWACIGSPNFTTEWQTYVKEFTVDGSMAGGNGLGSIAFNLSKDRANDVTYYFDNLKFELEKERPAKITVNYVDNSDMEGDDAHNFVIKENNGPFVNTITPGVGKDGSRGVKITSNAGAAQDWDTQFWIQVNEPLQEGTQVTVQFDYKASMPASADTQAHGAPGAYQHWACIGSPSFTTEWQTYTKSLTVDGSMAGGNGLGSIAFNLSKDKANTVTFYFDNIRVWAEKEQDVPKNTEPLTPEEKHDTLVWAMENFIAGMMEACEGNVKAWDVVNEAIGGAGNDEGFYPLQHGTPDNKSDFFWQDEMGDLEYVRQAVRLARKHYAASMAEKGGDDGKLTLFVNDYNLESDWDQNHKVKSLINWIKRWEADGVTKIDGIGSQMHISYYENSNILESKKKAISESFRLMAASGKLVRISELDMGYVKADGTDATLDEMTDEMEMKMEEYYKWIIEQYMSIIPANQQYGITQWCLTDSPKGSGWRADTPVGIWDLNWNRKYIYRGWTEGLKK